MGVTPVRPPPEISDWERRPGWRNDDRAQHFMSFVRIVDGTVRAENETIPQDGRRYDTGEWVRDLATATIEDVNATGWFQVTPTVRPADTDLTGYTRFVDGAAVEQWIERPKSTDEQAAERRGRIAAAIRAAVVAAESDLQTIIDTSGTMTGAQLSYAIRAVASVIRDLGRLALQRFDDWE